MSKPSFSFLISLILVIIFVTPGFSQTRVGKFGVGVEGSMQYLLGSGATNPSPGFGGGVNLSYSILESFSVRTKFGINQLSWKGGLSKDQTTDLMSLNLYFSGDLMPNSKFNVFPFVGGGLVFYDPKNGDGSRAGASSFDMQYSLGAGIDYFLNEFWSITGMGEYVFTGSRYFAGSPAANPNNDSFMRVSLQVRYYFFDQTFITKLLKTQRDKSKRGK
jgi:hypothetical protein